MHGKSNAFEYEHWFFFLSYSTIKEIGSWSNYIRFGFTFWMALFPMFDIFLSIFFWFSFNLKTLFSEAFRWIFYPPIRLNNKAAIRKMLPSHFGLVFTNDDDSSNKLNWTARPSIEMASLLESFVTLGFVIFRLVRFCLLLFPALISSPHHEIVVFRFFFFVYVLFYVNLVCCLRYDTLSKWSYVLVFPLENLFFVHFKWTKTLTVWFCKILNDRRGF